MEFYQEHWMDLDDEHLTKYDETFQWLPILEPIMQDFNLEEAKCLVDYGAVDPKNWTSG